MQTKIRGIRNGGDGNEVDVKVTRQGDLIGSPHLPKYTLASAAGDLVRVDCTTAVASVTAIPTTTAMLTVWNGDSTKAYAIDQLLAAAWGSDNTGVARFFILACLHPVGMDQPDTQDLTPIKLNADGNYGGNAWCDVGATVVNDGWVAWGEGQDLPAANDDAMPGKVAIAYVDGRMVLPPRAGLSLVVMSDKVAVTVKVGMMWYEVPLDLG